MNNIPATLFVEDLRDCFLFQHIMEPAHTRDDQSTNTLDLIIAHDEEMIGSLKHVARQLFQL